MADKVVQRLSNNTLTSDSSFGGGKGGVFAKHGSLLQTKCAECEEEDKVHEKKEEGVQRKPIFESNGEQPEAEVQTKPIGLPPIQTKCASCEEEEIQAKSEGGITNDTSSLESKLSSNKGSGNPLSPKVENSMGSAFGADFSGVRIHTGSDSVQMNRQLGAQAFTHGNDIYFNQSKYNTDSTEGKHLLAHELTHTIQQKGIDTVQKVCDTSALVSRTEPIFFPKERNILRVYQGRSTLRKWGGRHHAVGLVQQALVDLGHNLGSFGPNADGVDRKLGPLTETAIISFQNSEGIASSNPGEVDQETLKCMDEIRSKLVVPAHQSGSVDDNQYLIDREITDGRDEDVHFARGVSTLDTGDKLKIWRLLVRPTNPIKGCNLTLKGFISEDELVMMGPSLATDRINSVNNELIRQDHNKTGADCSVPPIPIRTLIPLPNESSGISDYPRRRKVEIVPEGQTSTSPSCTVASPNERSLTTTEDTDLALTSSNSADWIDNALLKLVAGNLEGDAALETYFGAGANRTAITSNLAIWANHLRNVIPRRKQAGTECNDICGSALASNSGRGRRSMMTLCPEYFGAATLDVHPGLTEDQKKAFIIMHEAGHGSIDTVDTAYGHRRLIEFLNESPSLAENNTDSYTLMILCLNGFSAFCDAPVTSDNFFGLANPAEEVKARRGLAWLQTWLIMAYQNVSSVYTIMEEARENGISMNSINSYYSDIYELIIQEFGIRRPPGNTAPTFNEQSTVAAIVNRLLTMNIVTEPGLNIKKDTSNSPRSRWSPGPGRIVFLEGAYFLLTKDRTRVESMLPLLLEAMPDIESSMRIKYENLVKSIVQENGNPP